eukprot:410429_1
MSKSGIKMGVDAVMEPGLYGDPTKNKSNYDTSINPTGVSDDEDDDVMQEMEQQIAQNRSSKADKTSLFPADHDENRDKDFDPMSQKHKQIQSKNNPYQNR